MRMSHGRYPCSEQADESSANTPEAEKQEGDHETPSCHRRSVSYEVARIAGDEAHKEEDQGEDGSCQSACQETKPATDGDAANDNTNKKTNEQREREREEFPCRQGERRLDSQPIHRNLLFGDMKSLRIDEGDHHGQQGSKHACNNASTRGIIQPSSRKERLSLSMGTMTEEGKGGSSYQRLGFERLRW
jgi:hypothetical protein